MEKEKLYWITKEGEKLDIDKMDIDHLRNIVKMIVRKNNNINNIDLDYDDIQADILFNQFEHYKD